MACRLGEKAQHGLTLVHGSEDKAQGHHSTAQGLPCVAAWGQLNLIRSSKIPQQHSEHPKSTKKNSVVHTSLMVLSKSKWLLLTTKSVQWKQMWTHPAPREETWPLTFNTECWSVHTRILISQYRPLMHATFLIRRFSWALQTFLDSSLDCPLLYIQSHIALLSFSLHFPKSIPYIPIYFLLYTSGKETLLCISPWYTWINIWYTNLDKYLIHKQPCECTRY